MIDERLSMKHVIMAHNYEVNISIFRGRLNIEAIGYIFIFYKFGSHSNFEIITKDNKVAYV